MLKNIKSWFGIMSVFERIGEVVKRILADRAATGFAFGGGKTQCELMDILI